MQSPKPRSATRAVQNDEELLAQAIAQRERAGEHVQQQLAASEELPPPRYNDNGATAHSPPQSPYVDRYPGSPNGGFAPPRSPYGAPPSQPSKGGRPPPTPNSLNRIGSGWQVSSAHQLQNSAGAPSRDEPSLLTTSIGRTEVLIATVLSMTDIGLQICVCFSVHMTYGQDPAEPFWAAIIISLLFSLLGLVSFVSRQPPGSMLQRRLAEKGETTSAILLIAVAHPELLKFLTPSRDTDSQARIIKLDLARSLVAAIPYLPMTMNFVVSHGFEGRYWEWPSFAGQPEMHNITYYVTLPCTVEPGSGDNNTSPSPYPPPLPPPPPPYSPTDESGGTSYLMIVSFGWTIVTLSLKLLRMMLITYIRQNISGVQADLDAANEQLATQQAELDGLREYYRWYNNGQDYKVDQAAQQEQPHLQPPYDSASHAASPYIDGGYSETASSSTNYY